MPINVACGCGRRFAAKDELAGKRVKCPNCSQPLSIPSAAAPPPPPPAARSGGISSAAPMNFPPLPSASQTGGSHAWNMGAQPGYPPANAPWGGGAWNGAPGAVDQTPFAPSHPSMVGGFSPGMGLPAAGMPGMGMPGYGYAPQPRRRNSSKKAILWTSIGGGAVLVLFVIGLVVVQVVNRARSALAVAAASRPTANSSPSNPTGSRPLASQPTTPPVPSFPSITQRETPLAEQQANDALVEKFCSKLEEYANLLAGIQNGAALQSNANRIEQLANEVNSMRHDILLIDVRVTPAENNRLSAKYKTRMENASRRAKSEDDRISLAATRWQTDAIMERFRRPDFGTPPGMASPPGVGAAPAIPTPAMPAPGTPGVVNAPGMPAVPTPRTPSRPGISRPPVRPPVPGRLGR